MRRGKRRRGFRGGRGRCALTRIRLPFRGLGGPLLRIELPAFLIELSALLLRAAQRFIRGLSVRDLGGPLLRIELLAFLIELSALLLRAVLPFCGRQFLRLRLRFTLGFLGGMLRLLGGLLLRCQLGDQSGVDLELLGAVRVVLLVAPVARARDRQRSRGDRCQH